MEGLCLQVPILFLLFPGLPLSWCFGHSTIFWENTLSKDLLQRLFKYNHKSAELMGKWEDVLRRHTELNALLTSLLLLLLENMGVEKAAFILKGERELPAVVGSGYGSELDVVSEDLIALAEGHKGVTLVGEADDASFKPLLQEVDSAVLIPLCENDCLIGVLLLGNKKCGDNYTKGDIRLLEVLARQSAITIQNLQFYEETQTLNERLREKIREATLELKAANENLRELVRDKDEFISALSRQLCQSLAGIKRYISLVAKASEKLTEEEHGCLDKALVNVDNLVKLIDDLVAISGMSQDLKVRSVDFPLDDLIYLILREEKPKAESKGLRLNYHRQSGPIPSIKADPDKLRNALFNLIDNAVNHTEEGSVVIETSKEDGDVVVSVTDTGSGIPEGELSRIFSCFPRETEAEDIAVEGSGLGMLATKKIIEAHKGRMWVESAEGKGSTVRFSIPLG